jgi:hypothetical protein
MPSSLEPRDDAGMPDSPPGLDLRSCPMRTIKLCASPTRREATLLGAIARSVKELERSGRASRPVRLPVVRGAFG